MDKTHQGRLGRAVQCPDARSQGRTAPIGTRGFITFVVNGVEKTAYNHFDSYPDGVGLHVLGWLRRVCTDLDTVREQARALRVVDPDSTPTAEDIERLRDFADHRVSSQRLDEWYVLLRKTQGRPEQILRAGVIEDSAEFPTDSLFAEWGYVIDLDAQAFEIYRGFQKRPHSKGRFADRAGSRGYAPVALAKTWPLRALPDDMEFLDALGVKA